MALLRSYVSGEWHTSAEEGVPLHDATTGEEVARVSSAGVDMAATLDYGRRVGGPALRELTFHQRAALLKALASHLREHRDELYALSAKTGATLGDSKFDIDGGIGVLFTYGSKGKRELPNSTVYVDGAVEPLSKGGTFAGQHIATPLRGVAIQINAFNFPVWGPLEKFAPAFLAGVPSLVKPASQTAYLTARLVELIIESGILPEGSLQFIAGSVGDLLDHVTAQDLVSFTGSASTAQKLRAHPAIIRNAVRFNAEADSLNLSILGPDAKPGTVEFDLFVKQLTSEMTVKAGQKCTAIRRAFVPAELLDAVAEAASARLAKVTVGNPTAEGVRMGALASLEQREEVRRSLKALLDAGSIVFGDPEKVDVVDADAERGAFISPVLLKADPERAEPHEVEAFGPVSTLLPYTSTEQLIDYAARGEGSLAGSIVTADTDFAREIVLGVAPWHGRLLVLDADDAKESTGHGSPMPQLVHGGPGRAGGGEEMGGIRGVMHHLQRTAVQGTPKLLSAVTGQWVAGAPRTISDEHPFRKSLAELKVGDAVVAGPRQVTQADIDHFTEFTGDSFYAHTDPEAAAANPLFGGIVAHGYLVVSFAAGLFVSPEPGPVLANYGLENLRFLTPVKVDDTLTVTLTAKQITPRVDQEYGEVRWDADVTNQNDESVAKYDVLTLVAKEKA
ncbi:oxepin-CoA hydrolase / 3-oxo-5,6-dehydrosuberyl-CoA semialdehyde dehydrogenase [Amycolatopsis xylanica]|uniref:Oxepin-CoA hydrolase / 3-oxo-5,6-dehydrosuberyl-CoA semialdehyde dehydrogenase n=1 Tax=Amycolatopsis xylanica TaxID=589385 RepID=A0A1H3N9E1_9PSEU|nr:phenylacetic acid degradation bifunctional protein PaaZ [Amycolatopsis xylanica]SDY85468.1 oxepin-CoA hydrolase / 3-oxo-5,6-dehydrosuberyl-CoA semialdehyde dehydrogenase [Amycolatopsis xylanica]